MCTLAKFIYVSYVVIYIYIICHIWLYMWFTYLWSPNVGVSNVKGIWQDEIVMKFMVKCVSCYENISKKLWTQHICVSQKKEELKCSYKITFGIKTHIVQWCEKFHHFVRSTALYLMNERLRFRVECKCAHVKSNSALSYTFKVEKGLNVFDTVIFTFFAIHIEAFFEVWHFICFPKTSNQFHIFL